MSNSERRVRVEPAECDALGLPPIGIELALGASGLFAVPPRRGDNCYLALAGPPGGPLGLAVYLTRARTDDELLDEVRLRVVPRPPVRWSALTDVPLAGRMARAVALVHGVSLATTHCAAVWIRDAFEGAGLLLVLYTAAREGTVADARAVLESPTVGAVARSLVLADLDGAPRSVIISDSIEVPLVAKVDRDASEAARAPERPLLAIVPPPPNPVPVLRPVAPPVRVEAPVSAAGPAPAWLAIEDGAASRAAPLLPMTYLGRGVDNTVYLGHMQVSKRHARIEWRDGAWLIEDLASANGTTVDGVTVREPRALRDGAQLGFGPARAVFRLGRPPALAVGLAPVGLEAGELAPNVPPPGPAYRLLSDECARRGLPVVPVPVALRSSLVSFGQGFFSTLDPGLRPREASLRAGPPPLSLGDHAVVRFESATVAELHFEVTSGPLSIALEVPLQSPAASAEQRVTAEACILAARSLMAVVDSAVRSRRWPASLRLDVHASRSDASFSIARAPGGASERIVDTDPAPPSPLRTLHQALGWVLTQW